MNRSLFPISISILMLMACNAPPLTPGNPAQATADAVLSPIDRLAAIPAEAVKMNQTDDPWQPVASAGWSKPEPLGAPINTAGGEDSPFITLDGLAFYFFFTPDVRIPAEKQLLDGVTGIWVAHWTGAEWGRPERVLLAKPGELHLDGCPYVLGNWMAFCSARQGNSRKIDLYTASLKDGSWVDWQNWGGQINVEYQVGELHVTADGQELYFSSTREGGLGGYDLWTSKWTGNHWGYPLNLGAPVNTTGDEGRPFVSFDGQELWFDRMQSELGKPGPAVYRSLRQPDSTWGKPEELVSSFAGEPSLTRAVTASARVGGMPA